MPDLHELRFEVALAAPPAEVWEVLTRPAEVAGMTDPAAGVRLLDGPDVMAAGTANTLEVTGFGLSQKVVYTVTAFAPPAEEGGGTVTPGVFTEAMTTGPLPRFDNDHHVAPLYNSGDEGGPPVGCRVTDVFRFAPPTGLLGFVLTAEKIGKELSAAMAYRHARLVERFGRA